MRKHLIISPHPDDETLGCGGVILRARKENEEVYWLVVTNMSIEGGFSEEQILIRNNEIDEVAKSYDFTNVFKLDFIPSRLDTLTKSEIIKAFSDIVSKVEPTDIYIPFINDAHSDHKVVFQAGCAISKWFRHNSIERLYAYETQSETDFNYNYASLGFRPNIFVDISKFLDKKIEIASLYKSEFFEHPFPRSCMGIKSLSVVRGAASGFYAAEAFQLLFERVK